MRARFGWVCALVALGGTACGGAAPKPKTEPGPDAPVPASVPRNTVHLVVDLEQTADCEEDFDLAMYQHRSIDLIEWDEGDGCAGRHIEVRFLSDRIQKDVVLERVRDYATSVKEASE